MKSKFKAILFVFLLFLGAIYLTPKLRTIALQASSDVIFALQKTAQNALAAARKYLATTQEITALREENAQLQRFKTLYAALRSDYIELLGAKDAAQMTQMAQPNSHLVRIAGFWRLGEKTRFYAFCPDCERASAGLIYGDLAAGILTHDGERFVAIALQDSAAAVAASVGSEQGIVRGDGSRCWMDFLEDFAQISIGASVQTSGKDFLFPAGVRIGTIESIEQKSGYKRALLSGCAKLQSYRYIQSTQLR